MVEKTAPVSSGDRLVFEYLKTAAGSIEMNVNGGTPVTFSYAPSDSMHIERVNWTVLDDDQEDIDGFFSIAALANGLIIQVLDVDGVTVLQHFGTDDAAIKTHNDFGNLAGIDTPSSSANPGVSRHGVRWTIAKAGSPLYLRPGQSFNVTVQDDLTDFTQFRAMLQGHLT